MASKRAPPIAAPGARRVTFTGIMAVPDDFGRLRVLLERDWAAPAVDHSAARLDLLCTSAARGLTSAARPPSAGRRQYALDTIYEDGEAAPAPAVTLAYVGPNSAQGAAAQAVVTVPARHRDHWLAEAALLRGRPVRVEATVRTYQFGAVGRTGVACDRSGIALDLCDLQAAASPYTSKD